MKARVKETGEIVEVHDCSNDMYVEKYGEISGRLFHITELDFDNLESPDYWTRLEHTYAGMAMQGILSNQDYCKLLIDENNVGSFADDVSRCAKDFATTLVEKLKGE